MTVSYSQVPASSAKSCASITDNEYTHPVCRGVYVGTSQDYDFYLVDAGTWIKFQGVISGSVLPIQAVGARKNSGSAAPDAGDIVFLY